MSASDIFLALLAVLFPPLPVWIKRGICSADSLLNLLLFVLGYFPGLLHAWYVIARFPEGVNDDEYGAGDGYEPIPGGDVEAAHRFQQHAGSGRVTYVYVTRPSLQAEIQRQQRHQQEVVAGNGGGGGRNLQIGAGYDATQQGGSEGQGASSRPPPTYAEAVRGGLKPSAG